MPVAVPLVIDRIRKDIADWYKINIDHFRRQQVSIRYIQDRVGETLYLEKKKGKISNYRILPQGNVLNYWVEKDNTRHYFEIILLHRIDTSKAVFEAYDRAMKGI